METRKYFGTDGIRGRVGVSYINPEFVLKLGWAVGKVLANGTRKRVLIGKDTRISGYMLESALEAGLSAAGVDVTLLGPMPTPAIAYLVQTTHAAAGIVISASHNLFEDNGIKFFSSEGCKLPDEMELAIEQYLDRPLETVSNEYLGKARRMVDAPGRYIEFCKSTIPSLTRLSGLKMVVDCAQGATYHIAPHVYTELGADVLGIAVEPNGFNINANCGSTDPERLQEMVIREKADIGIALDGDGDRVILVDAKGEIVNGDQILYIIAKNRLAYGRLIGGVVGTVMSNYGLEKAIQQLDLAFFRAKVGDRYVLEALKERGWKLGGEPSGHVVCLDKTTTGDGIVASLQVLACMVIQQRSLAELKQGMTLFPQVMINVKTADASRLVSHPQILDYVQEIERDIAGAGRVLVRPSGTEPALRLMVEGENQEKIKKIAHDLADYVSQFTR